MKVTLTIDTKKFTADYSFKTLEFENGQGKDEKKVTFKVKGHNFFGLGPLRNLKNFPDDLSLSFNFEWWPRKCQSKDLSYDCPVMIWKSDMKKYNAELKPNNMKMSVVHTVPFSIGCDARDPNSCPNCQLELVSDNSLMKVLAGMVYPLKSWINTYTLIGHIRLLWLIGSTFLKMAITIMNVH